MASNKSVLHQLIVTTSSMTNNSTMEGIKSSVLQVSKNITRNASSEIHAPACDLPIFVDNFAYSGHTLGTGQSLALRWCRLEGAIKGISDGPCTFGRFFAQHIFFQGRQKMQRNHFKVSRRRARKSSVLISSLFMFGTTPIVSANTGATWNGVSGTGGNGNWTDSASWSTGIVPENTSTTKYDIDIDGGKAASSTVTIPSGNSFHIDNLTTDSGDSVLISNSGSLNTANDGVTATITNNGLLSISSTANFTDLTIAGTVSLTGTGTVQLSNNVNNRIYASANQSLTIGSGQTILGAGQIGVGQTTIVNNGIIDANASAGMTLASGAGGITNTNLIEAGGAVLTINSSTVTNTSATISALAGGEVKFSGVTVTGGTLSATGTGFMDFSGTDTLSSVTINGNSTQENSVPVSIAGGALANNGTYSMNSSGNNTDLNFNANTAFNGTGTFQLSNFNTNRIYALSATQTMTIGSGQTFQGSGQIGVAQTVVTNNGIIDANGSAGLSLSVSGTTSTNSNTIEATNGGTLTLTGTMSNTGSGVVTSTDTAAIVLTSATLSNNSITGTATGKITSTGTSALNSLTVNGPLINNGGTLSLNTVTLSGNYTANNASITDTSGTLTNNATISLNGGANNTDWVLTANTTLAGTGSVLFSNSTTNRIYANAQQTLTIGSGQTLQGSGQMGFAQTAFVNNGIINANSSAGLTISPNASGFTNNNLLEATSATLTLIGSYTNTAENIEAVTSGAVKLNGASVTGGILSTTGTAIIDFTGSDTINNVTINGNSTEENAAAVTIAGGSLVNNGIYSINSTGNFTDLIINATTTISGSGSFQLSNSVDNRIYASGGQTLTLGSGETIQGAGQLGFGQIAFVNNGSIIANSSAGMTVSTNAGGFTNNNVLEANGAVLTMVGSFTNTGHTIQALASSELKLNGATVIGGILSTTGTGFIDLPASDTLNNVTINGNATEDNSAAVTIAGGALANNGIYSMNSSGNSTDIILNASTAISGTGTFQLSNFAGNRIYGNATTTLTIGSGQTFQGSGQLGVAQTVVTNNGIIDANASAGLTLSVSGTTSTNSNTIEATNGSTLTLTGTMSNTGSGVVTSTDTAAIVLASATLNNNSITGTATGKITSTGTSALNSLTVNGPLINNGGTLSLNTVTLSGNYTANNASITDTSGSLTNNATFSLNAGANNTDWVFTTNTALSGTGTVQLSNSVNNRVYAATGQTVTIGSGQTFQGSGQIGGGQTVIINNGVIDANTSAGLTVSVVGTTSANNNLMEATSGGSMRLVGTMANTGTLSTDNTSSIVMAGTVNQTGGHITNAGSATVTGTVTSNGTSSISNTGNFKVDAGGTATFATALGGGGNVVVGDPSGGISHLNVQSITQNSLLVDVTGRFAISTNTVTTTNTLNSLTINTGGQLDMGNNHLFINYGAGPDPIASVAAELATGYAAGAWNGNGINSSAAAAHSASYGIGYADSADPGNPAGLSSGQIEIKYTLLGDANLDGVVNGVDFGILAANFNKGITGWDQGDFNYDNAVNGVDFGFLAANFNKGASGAAVGSSALSDPALVAFAEANGLMADVPEPASLGISGVIVSALLRRRRKR
jgi:hypothetical protein